MGRRELGVLSTVLLVHEMEDDAGKEERGMSKILDGFW